MLDSIITSEITPAIFLLCSARRGLWLLFFQLQIPCDCTGKRAVSGRLPRLLPAAAPVRTLAVWSGVSYAVCIPRSESRSNRSGAASALRWKTNASSRRTGRWTACLTASTGRTPPAPLRPSASASASPSPRASQKPTTAPSAPACRKKPHHICRRAEMSAGAR